MTPLKAKAAPQPQTIIDVERAIAKIGSLQETLDGNAAALEAHIATLRERALEQAKPLQDEIARLSQGVQAYCETRRAELTEGKTKSLKFVTGTVSWRKGRARVEMDHDEAVIIARLKRAGLAVLVRLREELDKGAILARPSYITDVPGVRVVVQPETFTIEPKKG